MVLPKFSVRGQMRAVALLAVVLGAATAVYRRQENARRLEAYHKSQCYFYIHKKHSKPYVDRGGNLTQEWKRLTALEEYHFSLELKYRLIRDKFWIPLPQEPDLSDKSMEEILAATWRVGTFTRGPVKRASGPPRPSGQGRTGVRVFQ
jgi:hypothetical protein